MVLSEIYMFWTKIIFFAEMGQIRAKTPIIGGCAIMPKFWPHDYMEQDHLTSDNFLKCPWP